MVTNFVLDYSKNTNNTYETRMGTPTNEQTIELTSGSEILERKDYSPEDPFNESNDEIKILDETTEMSYTHHLKDLTLIAA